MHYLNYFKYFLLCALNVCEIQLSTPFMYCFFVTHSSWDIFILLLTITFLVYYFNDIVLQVLWVRPSLSNMSCYYSHSQLFLLEFYLQCYHTRFLCYICIFVGQFPFSIIYLLKCRMGLSLRDKKATQLHTLLSVYKLNKMH